MTIRTVMSAPATTCAPTESIATAARRMAESNVGFLPVIGAQGDLVGVLTDRDVCLSIAHEHRAPINVPVGDIMTRQAFSCLDTDDAHVVLAAMKKHHVRRVPIVDRSRHVQGVVSIDDLLRRIADPRVGLESDAVLSALRAVCGTRTRELAVHVARSGS